MIRSMIRDDVPALKRVIDATGLFPSEMLDSMVAGFFAGETEELWFADDDGEPVACAYCAPERMTEGTWNLYLIAVCPDRQGRGHGAAMMRHVERVLADRGGRLLLVETSGLDDFEPTRAFYRRIGYEEERASAGSTRRVTTRSCLERRSPSFKSLQTPVCDR